NRRGGGLSRNGPRAAAGAAAAVAGGAQRAPAATSHKPPVFASQNGVLDILMIARAKPIPTISFNPPHSRSSINPIGWAYEICKRPASGLSCPTGTGVWDYGGGGPAPPHGGTLRLRLLHP